MPLSLTLQERAQPAQVGRAAGPAGGCHGNRDAAEARGRADPCYPDASVWPLPTPPLPLQGAGAAAVLIKMKEKIR